MNYKNIKRGLDIAGAAIGMTLTAPVMLAASAILYVQNKGDVFYPQERVGKDGKKFNIYKFKTMRDDRDKDGKLLSADKRVTKFGGFLRTYGFDEFPQFYNILKGDMSFVGPRPLMTKQCELNDEIKAQTAWAEKYIDARQSVRPGLVSHYAMGRRHGETKRCDWDYRLSTDRHYATHMNFLTDASLLVESVGHIFKGKHKPNGTDANDITLQTFLERAQAAFRSKQSKPELSL